MITDPEKDWPEYFTHENGNYINICMECKEQFRGHKRRVICRECMTDSKDKSLYDRLNADKDLMNEYYVNWNKSSKELDSLKKVYNDLAESHAKQVIEIAKLNSDCDNYRTVMIAAAEEIKRVWPSHCVQGYGPQNLLHRLEKGIPARYGYTAGAFEAGELKIKDLESELLKAKELLSYIPKRFHNNTTISFENEVNEFLNKK